MSSDGSPASNRGLDEEDDAVKSTIESDNRSLNDDDDGDLFGSDDDEVVEAPKSQRKLDDEELDSGDDEGRNDRQGEALDDEDIEYSGKADRIVTYDANLQRMKDPEVTDNDLYLVNLPPFLGIESENFDPTTYIPPSQGHAGPAPKDAKFSPFSAAATSLFWRHDPKDPSRIQSSARIVRWSDGSLTLQMASTPKDHYKISATALRQVPPNPKKPLPIHAQRQPPSTQSYDPNRDAHVYLAAAHTEDSMYRIVAPVTGSLRILQTGEQNDDAMMRLQSSLAKAAPTDDPVSAVREVKEDPELAKKRAELAEKEKLRAQRRRENLEQKEFDRKKTVLGRRGVRSGGVGLTVGGLEDDDGMRATRPKKAKRKPNRRGEIYTDDEDEGYARGRTKEDEYDEDDGFLVGSDEEPEIADDDEEEEEEDDPDVDDLEIEGRETILQGRSRAGGDRGASSPKRRPADSDDDDDEPTRDSPPARKRGKRVVEDDDDE